MKIEKLNEDKIRITLNMNDLKEKNIDFHSFMSNSLDSQSLFSDMLAQAEKQIGFVTKDYKVMIEALATIDGDFILTITRMLPDLEKDNPKRKKAKVSKKLHKPAISNITQNMAIYEFKAFDDFCDFCLSLDDILLKEFKKSFALSILYSYNSSYYLILNQINQNSNLIKVLCSHIVEFGCYVRNPNLFNKKLHEYGKVVMKKNAINTCRKHFSKI